MDDLGYGYGDDDYEEPTMPLEHVLDELEDKELMILAKRFGVEKFEETDKLAKKMLDSCNFYDTIVVLNDEEMDIFLDAVDVGADEIIGPHLLGYVYDGGDGYIVTKRVARLWEQLDQQALEDERKKISWMARCINMLENVLLSMTVPDFLKTANLKGDDLSEKECKKLFKRVPRLYNSCFFENGCVFRKDLKKGKLYLEKVNATNPSTEEIEALWLKV